jgi:hypothetical protein
MTKYFFLIFNLIGLMFFKSFFENEAVSVNHNFPATVTIGLEYEVEIKINKNEINGFAELRQFLPVGFNATVIECKGGSFSFSDREVKIIWMTIPSEKEFSVKYKVSVLSSAESGGLVDGMFSYLDNNQKVIVNLQQKKINVNAPLPGSEYALNASRMSNDSAIKMNNLPVYCSRIVNNLFKPNQILVEVQIKNDSVTGFAKLEELVPIGYTASVDVAQNAVFTFVDQKAKFLWMSFPFEKEFTVTYILTPNSENVADSVYITGYLSFTLAEVSKKFTIGQSLVSLKSNKTLSSQLPNAQVKTEEITEAGNDSKIAANTSSSEVKKDTTTPSINNIAPVIKEVKNDEALVATAAKTTEEKVEPKVEAKVEASVTPEKEIQPEEKKSETLAEAASNINSGTTSSSPLGLEKGSSAIPEAQKGISFRVQICATHTPTDVTYFKDTYKINEDIYAEMHEGWHKFTLNNVDTYGAARNKREEIKQNEMVKGPFVTAYNSGSRITVQEALMIANQKWVR